MYEIAGLQATPTQTFSFSITEGNIFFTLKYMPTIQMWYLDITFNDFILTGLKLTYSLNLLYKWKSILPFGITINMIEGYEPIFIDDFSSSRVTFNVLDQSEVEEINTYYQENNV